MGGYNLHEARNYVPTETEAWRGVGEKRLEKYTEDFEVTDKEA